jgi:murein DD-endopeptidase MepM/ murein hydrolase activator NlpD
MSAKMMRVVAEADPPAVLGADAPASPGTASDAVRANRDVRDVTATAVAACFTTELHRRHADWRRTLKGVQDVLAGLDRTCEATINTLTETEAEPAAAMSTLVDTLVAAATANADAAAQRTRTEAQIEIADLQALVDRLQAELHAAREQVQTAREECDEAHRARGHAEVARDEAQGVYAHLLSTSESQLHGVQAALEAERAVSFGLHQQLEAEQAERARCFAALETVRRAVSFAEPVGSAPDLPRPLTPRHAVPDRPPADREPAAEPAPTAAHAPAATSDSPDPAAAAPPVNCTRTLVSPAPISLDIVRKLVAACRRARPYSLLMLLDSIYRSRHRFWTTAREGRYTVAIADSLNGTVGRLTLGPILIGAISSFLLPILIGLGAQWSAQTEINHLRAAQRVLQMENGSYRAATGELTAQIQSLESVINDLGARFALGPVNAHAMQNLPAAVKTRASGGGSVRMSAALSNALAGSLSSPGDPFGALRGLLRGLENRLTLDRREALVGATPSVWPTHGWLTSAFGTRSDPFTGEPGYHQGLDISTEKGQPVLATADGAVESAVYAGDYGKLVVLKHGFGLSTRYGHLSGFAVTPGQDVKRGDVIGYVGSTGRSTGPHLHYEILLNDHPIDPLQLLTRPANR